MNPFRLGLVVHAVGLAAEGERLLASVRDLGMMPGIDLTVAYIGDGEYGPEDPTIFNPARAKNIGLRRMLSADCEGIVCIDADYIIPPGLFETLVYPVFQPYHVWVRRRDIDEKEVPAHAWTDWLKLPIFSRDGECRGSCNYLSAENWRKIGGWDERTFGWGGDDDILHARIAKTDIQRLQIDGLPLVHIKHPLRPWAAKGARGAANLKWSAEPQPNYLAPDRGETP